MVKFLIFFSLIVILITNAEAINPDAFIHVGTYGVTSFYVGRSRAQWSDAAINCKAAGLEFATPKTIEAFNVLSTGLYLNRDRITPWVHVGGISTRPGSSSSWDWSWVNGDKVNYTMPWAPNQPNNDGGNQNCLAMQLSNGRYEFDDNNCNATNDGRHVDNFVCQTK